MDLIKRRSRVSQRGFFFVIKFRYSLGTMIHSRKYTRKPGTPPGIRAMSMARRNQKALIPKNSPSPPQTPANTRFLRERRNTGLWFTFIFISYLVFYSIYVHCFEKSQNNDWFTLS